MPDFDHAIAMRPTGHEAPPIRPHGRPVHAAQLLGRAPGLKHAIRG
jgi:hypothetical protein